MSTVRCPRCDARPPLDELTRAGIGLHACGVCGGNFVERAVLDGITRDAARGRALREALYGEPAAVTADAGRVRYLPCASCGELMARKSFGGTSGIIVDVCRAHGTWFDATELASVLAFVAKHPPPTAAKPAPPSRRSARSSGAALASGGDSSTSATDVLELVAEIALWSWLD